MDSMVEVQGKSLKLSNLEKVLYPATGFTKQQVIDYYVRIAPAMLPHLAGRALTRKRYPNGVDEEFFYEKNAPQHRPDRLAAGRNQRFPGRFLAVPLLLFGVAEDAIPILLKLVLGEPVPSRQVSGLLLPGAPGVAGLREVAILAGADNQPGMKDPARQLEMIVFHERFHMWIISRRAPARPRAASGNSKNVRIEPGAPRSSP